MNNKPNAIEIKKRLFKYIFMFIISYITLYYLPIECITKLEIMLVSMILSSSFMVFDMYSPSVYIELNN